VKIGDCYDQDFLVGALIDDAEWEATSPASSSIWTEWMPGVRELSDTIERRQHFKKEYLAKPS